MGRDIKLIHDFGKVDAEQDSILEYFVTTQSYERIRSGETLLLLGRKGAGKTALVRYFAEKGVPNVLSQAPKFRQYPWNIHAVRKDLGCSEVETFVASWEYFIAVQLASLVYKSIPDKSSADARKIEKFLMQNYGSTDTEGSEIIKPDFLKIEGTFEPEVFGVKLGSVQLTRGAEDKRLGTELGALSRAILKASRDLATKQLVGKTLLLHFDELDLGLANTDTSRDQMLTGLILAARAVRSVFVGLSPVVSPVVYLRTDLWERLTFSDKNKIHESQSGVIEWSSDDLKKLIERRASVQLGSDVEWEALEDTAQIRGSQSKWNHIIARTYLRPRDAIKFCNEILRVAKARTAGPTVITNPDIVLARNGYSLYLKNELNDEVTPHWAKWVEALNALSATERVTFTIKDFTEAYTAKKSPDNVAADEALERLFQFSVIGYDTRSGYGGSSWVFKYMSPQSTWDSGASRCKVHLGLKEYCRLKEERATESNIIGIDLTTYADIEPIKYIFNFNNSLGDYKTEEGDELEGPTSK